MRKSVLTKIVAPLLAVCVLAGVYLPTSASTSQVDGYSGNGMTLDELFGYGQSGNPQNLEVYPGEEVRIPLTADMFTFKDGKVPIKKETISLNQMAKVKVRTKIRAGSKALDYVQLDRDTFAGKPFISGTKPSGATAYISVMFAKEFVSIEDQDFEFDVYLMVNKRTYDELSITLAGTMLTEIIEVYGEEYDYVDLSSGIVMEMMETQRNTEIDVGHGIRLYATMYKGQKYYGNVKLLEAKDTVIDELNVFKLGDELPELYQDVACVYRMDTVGFGRTVKYVKFNEEQEMHVYGEELSYLGTTAEELPYSNYYFMSYNRLAQLETDSEYAQEPGYAMSEEVKRAAQTVEDDTDDDTDDIYDDDEAYEAAPEKTEEPQVRAPRNNWTADELA